MVTQLCISIHPPSQIHFWLRQFSGVAHFSHIILYYFFPLIFPNLTSILKRLIITVIFRGLVFISLTADKSRDTRRNRVIVSDSAALPRWHFH